MASAAPLIAFTDDVGAATLTNFYPWPGSRFARWEPRTIPYGDAVARQSDGATAMFVYRTDYLVDLELPGISSIGVGSPKVAPVDIANRLVRWLLLGGTCEVDTGDADDNKYVTVGLAPGTSPTVTLTDGAMLEYTLKASLLNLAVSPGPFLCRYANQ